MKDIAVAVSQRADLEKDDIHKDLLIQSYQTAKISEEHQKAVIQLQLTEEEKQKKANEAEYYR